MPEGGYWRGAFWAPTSYQYIKGLSDYGYTDLAFEEALRHLTTVADVYEAGKSGGYVNQASIWENYSSEYLRPGHTGTGASSRANFAGWTGCLTIGVIIEDILGLDVNAPENKIVWDIRLPEEHGISDLYMKHEGVENRVDLLANKRVSAKDSVTFTVTADEDFTLEVKNGTESRTYNITAGTHTYSLAGENGEKAYIAAKAYSFESQSAQLQKDALDASAEAYVVFGTENDTAITDGLPQQVRKNPGAIKNVNTVGYPAASTQNPVSFRENDELQALGFTGARDIVKKSHTYGQEGFMFTVPASNELKTVRAVVGVRNATAELTASLSDSAYTPAKVQLSGEGEEAVYVVDIPFRAANDDRNILVKWTIVSDLNGQAGYQGDYSERRRRHVPGTAEECKSDL